MRECEDPFEAALLGRDPLCYDGPAPMAGYPVDSSNPIALPDIGDDEPSEAEAGWLPNDPYLAALLGLPLAAAAVVTAPAASLGAAVGGVIGGAASPTVATAGASLESLARTVGNEARSTIESVDPLRLGAGLGAGTIGAVALMTVGAMGVAVAADAWFTGGRLLIRPASRLVGGG